MEDYYKYYNKNNSYKLSRKDFSYIVSEMNKEVQSFILNEASEFLLPHRLGAITVRKSKRKVKFINGKAVNTNPPNWKKTLELWEADPEAKEKKILIKHSNLHTSGYVFKIMYARSLANFKNKSFYCFSPARQFKRNLTVRINDYTKDKFDSPKIY